VWQLLVGKIDTAGAQDAGVRIEGRRAALKRFGLRQQANAR
jgi:hypothetical protein